MMGLGLLKYARKATKSYESYLSKRKSQRTRERKTGKASRRKRLWSLIQTVLSVSGLLTLVLSAAGSHSATTTGTSSATYIPQLQQYAAIIDQGNRLSALQTSADSTLTAYPDDRSVAISSTVIDEKTGNQSYMRDAGNGGVSVAMDDVTGCPDLGSIGGQISKYGKLNDTSTCSPHVEGDLLTGNGGWLYAIPLDLTILSYSTVAILIAIVIAPLSAFGFNYGGFIAALLIGSSTGLMIKNAASFCILGLTMALTALVIIRILLINVYIILSPLAVIAAGLPGHTGQGFARQWIMGFLALLTAQFAQVVTLGVGMVVLTAYDHTYAPAQGDMGGLFIKYGILILMVRVPTLFSSNSTAIIREAGPALGGAILRDKAPFAPGE